MKCDCGEQFYVGKSLGDGLYNTREEPSELLEDMYDWMWEHLMGCEHPHASAPESLSREWVGGQVFTVVTEYEYEASANATS
jgi:hypothetical protein